MACVWFACLHSVGGTGPLPTLCGGDRNHAPCLHSVGGTGPLPTLLGGEGNQAPCLHSVEGTGPPAYTLWGAQAPCLHSVGGTDPLPTLCGKNTTEIYIPSQLCYKWGGKDLHLVTHGACLPPRWPVWPVASSRVVAVAASCSVHLLCWASWPQMRWSPRHLAAATHSADIFLQQIITAYGILNHTSVTRHLKSSGRYWECKRASLLTGWQRNGTTSLSNSCRVCFCSRPSSVRDVRAHSVLCMTNSSMSLRPCIA